MTTHHDATDTTLVIRTVLVSAACTVALFGSVLLAAVGGAR
jgi:hypothetical protein